MSKASLLTAFAIASIATIAHAQSEPRVYSPQFDNEARANDDVPQVQIWLEHSSYRSGQELRPYVVTEPGAYLTVFRITTDGAIQMLYPREPRDQQPYNPARFSNDMVPYGNPNAMLVRESSGNGFVFAVASLYKFDYEAISNRGYWSGSKLTTASRYGSPFQTVRALVEEITNGSASYSMDYVMYNVAGSDGYRSRYSYRYRNYAFNDYYDLCLNAFDRYYYGYCSGYGYYNNPYIIVGRPNYPSNPNNPNVPGQPGKRAMRVRPLTVDPVVPHVPVDPQPAEGRFAPSEPRIYRSPSREPMVTRPEPKVMRPEPRVDHPRAEQPRIERMERPRMDPPRSSPPPQRAEPQPRIERRADPPPQKIEKQKDN